MKKTGIIIFPIIILLIIISVCFFFSGKSNMPEDISKLTGQQIVSILQKNQDAKNYMQKYSDFKISAKTILARESILSGQQGQNFKEVYQGLELEDNRYLKVDLMNASGDRGLTAVIDYKDKSVPKAFGIILIKTNGQTAGQSAN